jgi:hypothetical protein
MTGKEIISKAMVLLGYNDGLGNIDSSRFQVVSKNSLNLVFADLLGCLGRDDYGDIQDLSKEIDMPKKVLFDVMPYGVAAFIAESIGDGDKQQYFAAMYNQKRKRITYEDSVQDVIPAP